MRRYVRSLTTSATAFAASRLKWSFLAIFHYTHKSLWSNDLKIFRDDFDHLVV
jgi:hypothetical protein